MSVTIRNRSRDSQAKRGHTLYLDQELSSREAARVPVESDFLVLGSGIAGLTCALTLRDRNLDATVYEASGRLGGRMFSNTGYFAANQVTE